MLKNEKEVEIMSRCRQPALRDPTKSRRGFESILGDFFAAADFPGSHVLELGPGQWDFAELLTARGAHVLGIDNDEAVVELGALRGHQVLHANLKKIEASAFAKPFDGVFCRGSINAFWFPTDHEGHAKYVARLASLVARDGWAWICPYNGGPAQQKLSPEESRAVIQTQQRAFEKHGFQTFHPSPAQREAYEIVYDAVNVPVFLRGLRIPVGSAEA